MCRPAGRAKNETAFQHILREAINAPSARKLNFLLSKDTREEVLSQGHANVTIKSSVMEYIGNVVDGTNSEWFCKQPEG